jgi:hypothetical protein
LRSRLLPWRTTSSSVASTFRLPAQAAPEQLSLTASRPALSLPLELSSLTTGRCTDAVMTVAGGCPPLTGMVGPPAGPVPAGAGATVTLSWAVAVGEPDPVPVASAVKLHVPDAVGVPEITPVCGSRFRPGGRLPAGTDQL